MHWMQKFKNPQVTTGGILQKILTMMCLGQANYLTAMFFVWSNYVSDTVFFFKHDVYLYGQIQNTLKPGKANYGYVIMRLYSIDWTGNGYCDKDYLLRYLWREVKVKFWYEVFVCSPKRCELSTRGYRPSMRVVVDQSSFHRLAILRIAGPPCLPGFSWWPALA